MYKKYFSKKIQSANQLDFDNNDIMLKFACSVIQLIVKKTTDDEKTQKNTNMHITVQSPWLNLNASSHVNQLIFQHVIYKKHFSKRDRDIIISTNQLDFDN